MDLKSRVAEMRARAIEWLDLMLVKDQPFGVHRASTYHDISEFPSMLLPATYNAAHCRKLLGNYEGLADSKRDELVGFINGFQQKQGNYRMPQMRKQDVYYPTWEYVDFHTTNYAMGAVLSIGGKPGRPLAFVEPYCSIGALERWLAERNMSDPWNEGNNIVNLASFYFVLKESGDSRMDALIEHLFEWHEETQDPQTGYWLDASANPPVHPLVAMAGASHNFHIYYYLNRPVRHFEKIVDGLVDFAGEGVTSACVDIDVVDVLANMHRFGYRRADIESAFEKKLAALLDFQNADGGFADVLEGDRRFDGWNCYIEPQGLSNCFATWFRSAAIGMICEILFPGAFDWHFRNTVGMGYFNRNYGR
ncbi:MAG: hypothetical protein C4520_01055 [Candidatus Abyssobacteria bacterium SURF_5]|uniref:Uncharacterized protein n=1 Tax=Abyssobacteria bacterium (strain SURF_5) TaxID=2093360 RepID=A0A3A4P6R7_ABYX5|nr:MAG: hypothetical protein C4520_01055 [Candidatus Abyssubacteria bacterium SURF_5]